jgi:very-short-patch-repair endonuclease
MSVPEKLLRFARNLRQSQTDAEQLLWRLLRGRRFGGNKFRRQYPVDCYIIDFYCHERLLAIELDGGGHGETGQISYDEKRDKYLNHKNIKVLRFWNHDVLQNTDSVLEVIYTELNK